MLTPFKKKIKLYLHNLSSKPKFFFLNFKDIILKTLLVCEPFLFHTYKMCRPGQLPGTESVCFEILGFDILIDEKLKPWVVEVNRCPSFGATQQIDYDIKSRLLTESFELLHLRASDRQRVQVMEKAQSKRRLYNGSTSTVTAARTESFDGSSTQRPSLADKSSFSLNVSNANNSASMASLSTLNMNNMRKYKAKEKKKQEIVS
jgi:hypothetical protein